MDMNTEDNNFWVRYGRQMAIPEFGREGQEKLSRGSALVVGAGGLGSPLLYYLAAAGLGRLGIVDGDRVEASNLHRQILYRSADVGRLKAEVAAERLRAVNSELEVAVYPFHLNSHNALDILDPYEVVADGSDNFPTRYLVNDACLLRGKPDVYGAVFRFEGQLSVFNGLDAKGERGPNYRDLHPEPPAAGTVPNCAEAGVLGVLPGIIGSMQAAEVIKLITGIGRPLIGRLFLLDASDFRSQTIRLPKRPDRPVVNRLIDYERWCGRPGLPSKSPREARQWAAETHAQWLDVREPFERAEASLASAHIPLRELAGRISELDPARPLLVFCRSGQRSAQAVRQLLDEHHFKNVYNLEGGLLAWRRAGLPLEEPAP